MYNKYLEIFIEVADCGSFTKAAEKLYISPTTIMKQMNLMENELGIVLLNRTNKGITLTDSGKQIYKDAKFIINFCNESIKNSKKLQNKNSHIVTIGTSLICPCKPLMDLWYKISDDYPEFKIKILPFEENHTNILSTLKSNGTILDFVVSPCDSKNWLENFDFFKLGEYRFCIAIPNGDPLAKKEIINIKDLSNKKVMVITGGDSDLNETIFNLIKTECENVEIKSAPLFYDINVFNECEESGSLLVTLECWKDIHPAFKTIPLAFDKTMPYGMIYSKTPSEDAIKFIEIIKKFLSQTN